MCLWYMYSSQNCRLQWSQTTLFRLWMWLYKSALLANTCKQTGHLFGRQCLERCLKRSRLLSKVFVHFIHVSVFFGFDAMADSWLIPEITRARVFIHFGTIAIVLNTQYPNPVNLVKPVFRTIQFTSIYVILCGYKFRAIASWFQLGLVLLKNRAWRLFCGLPLVLLWFIRALCLSLSLVPSLRYGNWV